MAQWNRGPGISRYGIDKAWAHIDGLVQERSNSNASALELRLSCTIPLIWCWTGSLASFSFSGVHKNIYMKSTCTQKHNMHIPNCLFNVLLDIKFSNFATNKRHQLIQHDKMKLPVQTVVKISPKWWYFHFSYSTKSLMYQGWPKTFLTKSMALFPALLWKIHTLVAINVIINHMTSLWERHHPWGII